MALRGSVSLIFISLTVLALVPRNHGVPRSIKVGAIFHDGDEDHVTAFHVAIAALRDEHDAPIFAVQPVIKWVSSNTDSFKTSTAVCELLEEGVAAIFGPTSVHTRGIVASITAKYDIPHIEYVWRNSEDTPPSPMTINLYPESEMISRAIADVIQSMRWRSYAAIYETNDGLSRIQKALAIKRNMDDPLTIRQLGPGPDWRPVFKEITNMSIFNVIVDVAPHRIIDVLTQAKEVNLLADYCNFVIAYLDSGYLPIVSVRNGTTANVTGFSLLTEDRIPEVRWVEDSVLYDAVFLFNRALEALHGRNTDSKSNLRIDPVPLSCDDHRRYKAGSNITSLMRELGKEGKLTGSITIDEDGRRGFELQVLDFRSKIITVGGWNDEVGFYHTRSEKELASELFKSIEQKKFKITTRVGPPYVIEVTDGSTRGVLIDQKYYEGYCIELIDKIAKHLNFKYEFELVPDNSYGNYDPKKKTWNGLIKRLLDHEADLAICDLTITYQRQAAVDFTMPFMNLGISILFAKPEEKQPDLFSFMSPLSADVWIYMVTAYLVVSLLLYLQARMAPSEWGNPHPCNPEPEELENSFDIKNSLWLTVGSLMQQGSDILPKAPSLRMLAGMWWFFTLIMVSSYTANLAAFLTAGKMESPIKGADDLAKQTKIKYGAVKGGATSAYFRDSNFSTYQRMWATMQEAQPSVFTENNEEGVERVMKSKRQYAFLMESTSIEYRMERNCDIQMVGALLDNKGYGIALPLNSPYRTPISSAILTLQEKGVLKELRDKWWVQEGGGKCKKEETDSGGSELGLPNVGGVFLVLMFGCLGSSIIGIFEFLWHVRKVAVEEKITPWEAMVAELKFAINIWEETKPAKISKSTTSGTSSTDGAIGRGTSAARSLVGSFVRLDILDKFEKDNNTNNTNNKNNHQRFN